MIWTLLEPLATYILRRRYGAVAHFHARNIDRPHCAVFGDLITLHAVSQAYLSRKLYRAQVTH